jgi:hypothetical protein
MIQGRDGLHLAREPGDAVGVRGEFAADKLDGARPLEKLVLGQVGLTHAPFTEESLEQVGADPARFAARLVHLALQDAEGSDLPYIPSRRPLFH